MKATLKKTKLLYRILLFVLPLLVLSIVVTGAVISWTSFNYFQKTIDQDYRGIIKGSAGEIRLYLKNAQKNLESLALVMTATKLDQWQEEIALTAFIQKTPEFRSVSLFSPEGAKIASTGGDTHDIAINQDKTFKEALTGQNAVSGVMLSRDNIPYIHVASPVFHLGKLYEILWGELNLKSVWDILEGIRIGQTGQVFITDLTGQIIGHREMDRVVRAPLPQITRNYIKIPVSDSLFQWFEERDDTRYYNLGYHIPDLDWVIVLSQAYPETYSYLYKNIYWAAAVTCLICLLAIGLGWRQASKFLRPIQDLHSQVKEIGRGNIDQKVSIISHDEIGDLGTAFNEMTDSLKTIISREVETAKELTHAKNLAVLGVTSSKVTHEVGNLLNNVGLTLSSLKSEPLSERGQNALKIIEKDAARVREFIQNFLQFAKKPELHPQRVSMGKMIQEVLLTLRVDAENRGIRFLFEWDPDLPSVNVDPRLMYQVLTNLIKNGLEAMTDSGEIVIDEKITGDKLLVTIKDTGPGMEQNILDQIFDPFFTTKGKKGTGLGLSIVKTIVETHRGSIECRSKPGAGTTFMLHLPLY